MPRPEVIGPGARLYLPPLPTYLGRVVVTERRWLWVLLLVALVLRLGWGLTRPTTDAEIAALPDQREYLDLGRNLLHNGTLSFHDPRFDQTVYAYRTPGYPAFVALCGGSPRAARAAQAS